jgi:hypothetical protein
MGADRIDRGGVGVDKCGVGVGKCCSPDYYQQMGGGSTH